ncbi:MAG: ribosome maturation factor RimP [Elusimicrobiaceae bacterium]|nr:ribosome maturation factor RimP [Elusimicrobiaceae bacterium]MBT3955404.1 ribosome maturation factor RimP [Elusimicrobiaceae bacterium]MBT4007681.1 ribosome maturation factor RimP [Elusimicrobiaceae bacterium]MBT4402309.1 ribosome maturation factor RimP [Elusimicrobiaceae bacterium]MBT4439542.1 ribosome maturation factor RimP [Elusimicrobiaceae bacterium]
MATKHEIEEQVSKALEPQGVEVVDLVIKTNGPKKELQFFLDKEGGINLGDCQDLSDKVESILDMEKLVEGAYILEVSSPGIYRALKKPEHFKKFIGSRVKIFTKEAIEKRGMFTGSITKADDKGIILDDGTTEFDFKYDNIKKANLNPELEFRKI